VIYYLFLWMNTLYSIALLGTRPVVSLFAESLGWGPVSIGLLVSTYAFFPMLMAISVGKWLDRFGPRIITLLGGLGMVFALSFPLVKPTFTTLLISQVIMGFSQLCVLVSLQKTVGNMQGSRDRLMAGFSLTGSTGEFMGPLISGYTYEHFGFQWSFLCSLCFVILALGMGLSFKTGVWKSGSSTTTSMKTESFLSTVGLLKQTNLRKALMISGMVLYSKDLFVAYFPVYATNLGLSPSNIGMILSSMAAMAIAVRVSQFYLVNRFGRGKVMTTTLVISGVAFVLIPFNVIPGLLVVLALSLGIGLGLGQPLSIVYALNQSPLARQGEVLGLRLTINRASQFIFPLLFGSIGGVAGVTSIFWASGAFLLIGSYFTKMKKAGSPSQVMEKKPAGI
jgi:MFS family permease